tara:strand:+ start:191637 stop:191975 length:339 start_codon:yes stop_codon:yes gene_type:complete
MSGILSWVLILVGLSVLLLLVYYFRAPEKATNKIHRAIPFVIAVLAIWSLITSWMWFYLFNLVLSMPTLLLAIVLNFWAKHKKLDIRLTKFNWYLIAGALLLSFISFLFFMR